MNKLTTPREDGYFMPAEFAPHEAVILIWPVRPGSWGKNPERARKAFLEIIREASRSEKVYLLADREHEEEAVRAAGGFAEVLAVGSDDAWARDVAPTFVTNGRDVRGISWRFNAWGGSTDGLYASWDKDDAVAGVLLDKLGYFCYDAGDFVLEGGSIHSDGEGTVLTTESCLLSPGRNPRLSKLQIEDKLKQYLGAEKILWLPRGIYMDETNEHVDNVCAFTSPGEVVLAWTDDREDPQYELSRACLDYLEKQTDAKGRRLTVHRLPIPDVPVRVTREEVEQFVFEAGEDMREAGERLAASYVNFYFTNDAVLVPQFGGDNEESDRRALEILRPLCPGRRVTGIDSRAILLGGGNIHCITQQIPEGGGNE